MDHKKETVDAGESFLFYFSFILFVFYISTIYA